MRLSEGDGRAIQHLTEAHADGLRRLSMEPDFAAAAGMTTSLSLDEAAVYVTVATKAQADGRSFVFVLTDRGDVLGVCRLIGVLGVPRLIVAIGGAYRGQGNGSFLVKHVLEYAFETLQLDRVTAGGPCLRILGQFGPLSNGQELTREDWKAARSR
jgi:RimJ/RimL family protein N-acetyltransferase